jgi:hypothetical protein
MKRSFSRLALRILLDAFLYKLGFRTIEWTEEETAQWEQRNKPRLTHGPETIKKSESQLVKSELSALFNANNRTEMNSAAHEIEINDMVASLEYLDIAEISRSAIEMTFDGVKMEGCAPKVITPTGIQSRQMKDQWLFDEEIGGWILCSLRAFLWETRLPTYRFVL